MSLNLPKHPPQIHNVAYHPYFTIVTLCRAKYLIQNQMHCESIHSCQCSPRCPGQAPQILLVNTQSMYLPLCALLHQTVCINHHGTPRSRLDTIVCDELQWLLIYKRFSDLVEMNHGQQRPLLFSAAILKHLRLKLKCLGLQCDFENWCLSFLPQIHF